MKQCTSYPSVLTLCTNQTFTITTSAAAGVPLTFQHLDSNSYSLLGFVLIDAQGLCHYNLAETTFTKGLAQSQPAAIGQQTEREGGGGYNKTDMKLLSCSST